MRVSESHLGTVIRVKDFQVKKAQKELAVITVTRAHEEGALETLAERQSSAMSDAVRSILDGHIVLSRRLASAGHYPAVDVLESVSRVMPAITTEEHRRAAHRLLDMMATYREAEDLINIGAYVKGSNPRIDEALRNWDRIRVFLRQQSDEKAAFDESIAHMTGMMAN